MCTEIYYKVIEQDGKRYYNLYLKVGNRYVAIKTAFANDKSLLLAIAQPLPTE